MKITDEAFERALNYTLKRPQYETLQSILEMIVRDAFIAGWLLERDARPPEDDKEIPPSKRLP